MNLMMSGLQVLMKLLILSSSDEDDLIMYLVQREKNQSEN